MKFGRLPHSPEAVGAVPSHTFSAALVPTTLDRSEVDYVPKLYANDTLPDCTVVGYVNYARAVAALNGYQLAVNPDKVPAFYSNVIGNPPDLAATDGAQMLDVLNFQGANGVDVGFQSLVAHFGRVGLTRVPLAGSMAHLGGVYLGVTLYERDMETFGSAAPWDVEDGRDDGALVGRHCVFDWDYSGLADDNTTRLGTWGTLKPATWGWVEARLDEAFGLVWRQLARDDGTFYSGVTATGLISELT